MDDKLDRQIDQIYGKIKSSYLSWPRDRYALIFIKDEAEIEEDGNYAVPMTMIYLGDYDETRLVERLEREGITADIRVIEGYLVDQAGYPTMPSASQFLESL